MITKERIEELKKQGTRNIWYANGKGFPIQKCILADYNARYAELFFETEKEAVISIQSIKK